MRSGTALYGVTSEVRQTPLWWCRIPSSVLVMMWPALDSVQAKPRVGQTHSRRTVTVWVSIGDVAEWPRSVCGQPCTRHANTSDSTCCWPRLQSLPIKYRNWVQSYYSTCTSDMYIRTTFVASAVSTGVSFPSVFQYYYSCATWQRRVRAVILHELS